MKKLLISFFLIITIMVFPLFSYGYYRNNIQSFIDRLEVGVKFGGGINRAMGFGSGNDASGEEVRATGVYLGSSFGFAVAPNSELWIFDFDIMNKLSIDNFIDVSVFYTQKSFDTFFDGAYFLAAAGSNIQHLYYKGTIKTEFLDIPVLYKLFYAFNQLTPDIPVIDQLSASFITGPVMHILMSSQIDVVLTDVLFLGQDTPVAPPAELSAQANGTYGTAEAIEPFGLSWQLGLNVEYNLGRAIRVPFAGIITLDVTYNIGILEPFHYNETATYLIVPARTNEFYFALGYQLNIGDLIHSDRVYSGYTADFPEEITGGVQIIDTEENSSDTQNNDGRIDELNEQIDQAFDELE